MAMQRRIERDYNFDGLQEDLDAAKDALQDLAQFVGCRVRKMFGNKWFWGTVDLCDAEEEAGPVGSCCSASEATQAIPTRHRKDAQVELPREPDKPLSPSPARPPPSTSTVLCAHTV
jgi:hypothetical protein